MGYFDIIREGIKTGHRNLAVLLTQILAGGALLIVFVVLSATLALTAIGSLAGIDFGSLSPDNIAGIFKGSVSLVAMIVVFGMIFLAVAALITSYVHAGNLGCIISTARGRAAGFRFSTFFSTGRGSMLAMLGLYIIFLLIVVGTFLVFGAFAGAGIYAVLMPLKEAGRNVLAFGLGAPFFLALILAAMLCLFVLFSVWTFSSIILVGERIGAFPALKAAYRFIRANFWDFFLFALLMLALVFAANLLTEIVSMPYTLKAKADPIGALWLIPFFLIGVLLQMYVGLLARSSFAVYYVVRTGGPEAALETPVSVPPDSGPAGTGEGQAGASL